MNGLDTLTRILSLKGEGPALNLLAPRRGERIEVRGGRDRVSGGEGGRMLCDPISDCSSRTYGEIFVNSAG